MRRILWEWRGIKHYCYSLLYFGTLVGICAATRGAGRRGLDPGRVYLAMLLLFPVGLVGARLFSSSRTGASIGANLTGSGSFFQHPAARLGLGLALGGAGSNIHDRLSRGAVLDFLDLGWWPVFNLADVAISLGVATALWFLY